MAPPAPVQIDGTVRLSKSNAGGPPNMMHIEGDIMITKPGGQAPGGAPPGGPQGAPQGAPQGMAPQGMPSGGMPPR